jgi:signal transduction histidine kinase
MTSWALRVSPAGWGMIRNGRLAYTNRAFDVLDRGSVIGPGWTSLAASGDPPRAGSGPARSLREIAAAEALDLVATSATRRQRRFARGAQVVDIAVERQLAQSDDRLVLVLVRDVTELVRAESEVEALRARLIEVERTRVAGELAVGVAHDLGNLVVAMRAGLSLLPNEAIQKSRLGALREIVEAQVALVGRLQSVTSPIGQSLARIRLLANVVRPATAMVDTWLRLGGAGDTGPITIHIDDSVSETLEVLAPHDELINVMINLFFNARDAMPHGGRIRIAAQRDAARLLLRVEDEGTGIPSGALPRIFDPLFSTKGERGMGMGLANAAALMRRLGGEIRARNLPRAGASLELEFPEPAEPLRPAG